MLLDVPAIGGARNAEDLGRLPGVAARLEAGGQDHHVNWNASLHARKRVFDLDDQLALLVRHASYVRDLRNFAPHEYRAFFQDALVELVVILEARAYVDVEVVDSCARTLTHEVREFQA